MINLAVTVRRAPLESSPLVALFMDEDTWTTLSWRTLMLIARTLSTLKKKSQWNLLTFDWSVDLDFHCPSTSQSCPLSRNRQREYEERASEIFEVVATREKRLTSGHVEWYFSLVSERKSPKPSNGLGNCQKCAEVWCTLAEVVSTVQVMRLGLVR